MRRFVILTLAFAHALACAPPDTLSQMKERGILVQVPLNADDALHVDVEYEDEGSVGRADCVTLADDVHAEAGGLPLTIDERGRWQEADGLFGCDDEGCGACIAPRMSRRASDFDEDAPGTVVLEDETRSIALEIDGLFASRTVDIASPNTVRVGGTVLLDYSRPSDELETFTATFVGDAQGLPACTANFAAVIARESDDTGRCTFVVPAPQPIDVTACPGPWSGTLRVEIAPKFVVTTCDGVDRCRVRGNAPLSVEFPLDVVP